jgi:diguanylate cyclase (GGDEF)-like protein
MMLAGGALAAITALLPPPAEGSEAVILAAAAVAAGIGAYALLRNPSWGDHVLGAVAVMGTVLITIASHEGGPSNGTADNEILYLWICLYAFYFLALPYALIQIGFVGLAYGWLLMEQSAAADEALTRWLVTMTTLVVAGFVISKLRTSLYDKVGELSDQARHDSLTGLLNRSAFEERVAVERARSMRENTSLSILAVDVDGFKGLNDSLGHGTGDEVLRSVAEALQDMTREIDAVGRLGGDEFAVLVPGASENEAQLVAEDLRSMIAGMLDEEDHAATVSIGVATGRPPVPSFDELLGGADAAMYAGKRAGGNRVCVMPARADETEEALLH